jgi:hypothetical protein
MPVAQFAEAVVQLAEALIQGEVLITLQERGEVAPAWGYLNLLAHSNRRSLQRIRELNEHKPLSAWGTVVFDLIVDILGRVRTDEDLLALQRKALVPLELAVWDEDGLLVDPVDLDLLVRGAVYPHLGAL